MDTLDTQTRIMAQALDAGLLPHDAHDSRTVREVLDAGLVSATDVRRMYANWAPSTALDTGQPSHTGNAALRRVK